MNWREWVMPPEEGAGVASLRPGVLQAVDDSQLAEWVREQPEPLLPVLRQASFMRPLILLIAVLAPLVAFEYRPLTFAGAEWSLRALNAYAATSVTDFLDAPVEPEPARTRGQPALISWLTAGAMAITGPERNGSRSAAALACTMGLIFALSLVARRARGDRLALIAAILAAVQSPMLEFAQQPQPDGVTLFLVMLSLWVWQRHLCVTGQWLTGWLALSIVCLAGVFLAGGPIGLLTLAVMLAALVSQRNLDEGRGLSHGIALAVLALPLGLWWIVWIGLRHGPDAWINWWTLGTPEPLVDTSGIPIKVTGIEDVGLRLILDCGPWLALASAGAWSIIAAPALKEGSKGRESRLGSLVLVLLAGGAILCWVAVAAISSGQLGRTWNSLVVVSLWLLAATGVLAVAERRLPFGMSMLTLLAALAEFTWHWTQRTTLQVSHVGVWLISAGVMVAMLSLARLAGEHDVRRRAILSGLLIFATVGGIWLSAVRMQQGDSRDRQLQALRMSLLRLPRARSCLLVTCEETPRLRFETIRRRYLLRSLWPHLTIGEFDDKQPPPIPPAAFEDNSEEVDVVILWGTRKHVPGADFTLANSHDDGGLEVATYIRRREEQRPDEASPDL